jgi:hypothetical protein
MPNAQAHGTSIKGNKSICLFLVMLKGSSDRCCGNRLSKSFVGRKLEEGISKNGPDEARQAKGKNEESFSKLFAAPHALHLVRQRGKVKEILLLGGWEDRLFPVLGGEGVKGFRKDIR